MTGNFDSRPRTQIETCEHLAQLRFENPLERAKRRADERVYRFASVGEAVSVLRTVRGRW